MKQSETPVTWECIRAQYDRECPKCRQMIHVGDYVMRASWTSAKNKLLDVTICSPCYEG